jgi:hypothetical protein
MLDDSERTLIVLDVKKTYYPNPLKIIRMFVTKNKMRKLYINKLKQLVNACTKKNLRAFNGTDYRTSTAARRCSTQRR